MCTTPFAATLARRRSFRQSRQIVIMVTICRMRQQRFALLRCSQCGIAIPWNPVEPPPRGGFATAMSPIKSPLEDLTLRTKFRRILMIRNGVSGELANLTDHGHPNEIKDLRAIADNCLHPGYWQTTSKHSSRA